MFTQCSKCETVFRLPAEALRAAGGQVRCGRCGDVFNALARLAEDATAFPSGESPLELETRADAILQSIEPVSPAPAPVGDGDEIAQLQVLGAADEESNLDASLEFTLPPGELDRIFVETAPSPLQLLAASLKSSAAQGSLPQSPLPQGASAQAAPAPERTESVLAAPISGLEVSEDIRQAMLAGYQRAELPEINAPRRRQLPFAVWVSAAVVLTLLLAFQWVANNAEWLSVHAPLRGGGDQSAATLSAYQLRQWGVTGDPAANGTLRVRASIMNVAAQLEPYPLLRVTLADRFGTRVGAREFEPAEYLGRTPAPMLAPGERVDATLNILDPGKDAEGFEIDVCVRGAAKKIFCAADSTAAAAAPQSK